MNTWMKVLMWFGLGAGIGFFAGYQVGARMQKKDDEESLKSEEQCPFVELCNKESDPGDILKEYRGEPDDAEMPEEEPMIGDEEYLDPNGPIVEEPEIPQLHPQHLIPKIITEEEYYQNKWGYMQESLIFYDLDEVLYDTDTRSVIKDPDEVVGLATLTELNRNNETIFVINDTINSIFRIDWTDAAYCDEIGGANAPEYIDDDDDFTEEDIE